MNKVAEECTYATRPIVSEAGRGRQRERQAGREAGKQGGREGVTYTVIKGRPKNVCCASVGKSNVKKERRCVTQDCRETHLHDTNEKEKERARERESKRARERERAAS